MKKILLFSFIIPFLTSGQQFVDQMKGIYWTGTEEKFTDLDLITGVFTDIATLPNVLAISQGMSTFDKINNRYFFVESTMGIVSVDAQSGAILNNYPNPLNVGAIEYNENTDQIVGIYWTGTEERFAYLDLGSGVFTDIATLPNVLGVPQGMSTFDQINERYFFVESTMGVVSVDAQSGAILNNYSNAVLYEIEYIGEDTIIPNNIIETHFNKNLIKEVNLLGKTTKKRKNAPLLYIYDDGTVEKRKIIE